MARGRLPQPLVPADDQRGRLASSSQSTSMPRGFVQRARIVPACAEGLSKMATAGWVGVAPQTVGKRRRRFPEQGIEGPHDELRPGRPRTCGDERVAGLYLSPADNAVVPCVDGKSRIQALDRTRLMPPMGLGHVEGCTHDHVRCGCTM